MKRISLALLSLAFAFIAAPAARAQIKAVPHDSETVFISTSVLSNVDCLFELSPINQSVFYSTNLAHTNSSTWCDDGWLDFNLTVGQTYQIHLAASAASWVGTDVRVSAPPGYKVFISSNGTYQQRTSYLGAPIVGVTDHNYAWFTIMPDDSRNVTTLGLIGPPQARGNVFWSAGLGVNSAGKAVGSIGMSFAAMTDIVSSSSISLDTLTSTAYTNDFAVAYGTLSGETHEQFFSPQAFVDVRQITQSGAPPGFVINYYLPSDAVGPANGDGLYSVTASPWLIIYVQNYHDSGANKDRLALTRIEGSRSQEWLVTPNGTSSWKIEEVGLDRITTYTSSTLTNGDRQEDVTIANGSNTAATKTRHIYRSYAGVEELYQTVADPDTAALTTTYDYYYDTGDLYTGNWSRLKSVTKPDGSWVKYEYYNDFARFGQLKAVYSPWQDSVVSSTAITPSNASTSNCKVTLYDYAAERAVYQEALASVETKILGTRVAYATYSPSFGTSANSQPLRSETLVTSTGASSTVTTTRKFYSGTADQDHAGRLYSQTNPDGTKTSAYIIPSYFNSANGTTTSSYVTVSGWSTAVSGSTQVTSMAGYTIDSIYLVPNRSMRVTALRLLGNGSPDYNDTLTEIYTSGGTWATVADATTSGYGPYQWTSNDAVRSAGTQRYWTDGVPDLDIAVDGTTTGYSADAGGRILYQRKYNVSASGSYPAQDWIYTHYQYDGAGHVTWQRVSNSSSSSDPGLTSTFAYDYAGRLTSQTDASGLTTSYAYSNGGRTVTTTFPGGTTKITDTWVDGSIKSITGTAVVPSYQVVNLNTSDGTLETASYSLRSSDLSSPTSAPRWSKVTTDWAGRKVSEQHPAYNSGTFTKNYYYNSSGQLDKTTEPSMADTLVEYDEYGNAFRTGLDINANGTLDLSSTDRITDTNITFSYDSSAWWKVTTTVGYNQSSSSTPFTAAVTRERLTGFSGTLKNETQSTDVFGNTSVHTIDISSSSPLVTDTTTVPGSSTDAVSVTRNGLLQYSTSAQNLTSWTYYDSYGRPVKQTDPRTDTGTTARIGYYTTGTGSIGQVAWKDDSAGNRTSFAYDSSTGRLTTTTDPLGKSAYQSYNDRGQVVHTWGDTTYPVENGYDDYGQQTTMSTYRGGSSWTGSSWPTGSTGTADTTTWAYENATGLLLSKTDASSHAVSYTYNTRGQLAVRTWSRTVSGSALTTTYSYSSTTAEQTGIDYSDSTPDITYTYNRMGQVATVDDVTGTRTFAYNTADATPATETLPSYFSSRVLTRSYQGSGSGLLPGRAAGYSLSGASGSGTDIADTYGYDSYGRLNSVAASSGPSFTYSFASNSNLVSAIAEATSSGWGEILSYESNRNLITGISGTYGSTSKATFAYANDVLGRRTSRIDSGEVFSRYVGGGLVNTYAYNDRSELTSAQTFNGTSYSDLSYPLAGRNYTYAFDNIGNRSTADIDGSTTTFTSNNLNQYSQRTVPGTLNVSGLAPTNASVTVNSAASTRQGDYFFKALSVSNGSSSVWQSATAASSLGGSTTRYVLFPATPESYTYDADGNITADGHWTYTWDAENRLISMQTAASVIPNGDARRLEFGYDYLGRRVQKRVRGGYNGSTYTTDVANTRFVYNGWNVVGEYDALSSNARLRSYTWGLDLSGSLAGGGGVGGMLGLYDVSSTTWHLPLYDANGNVHALEKKTDGTVTAAYEYSPFGEGLRATGTYAASNSFRFSTKFTDTETNLVYYGNRYYDPSLGRFLGRDPSGEQGGIHLYALCGNDPINCWDYLGLDSSWVNPMWSDDEYWAHIDELWQQYGGKDGGDGIAAVRDFINNNLGGLDVNGQINGFGRFTNTDGLLNRYYGFNAGEDASFDNVDISAVLDSKTAELNAHAAMLDGIFGPSTAGGATQNLPALVATPPSSPAGDKVIAPNSTAGIDLRTPQQIAADESYAREVQIGSDARGQQAFGPTGTPPAPSNGPRSLIGTGAAAAAAEYYAGITLDPTASPLAKAGAWIGGVLTSIWLPDTAPRTIGIIFAGAALGAARPTPNFKQPTNPAQPPPATVPDGHTVRVMPPTEQYPNGYWRLEKPMPQGGAQGIDPSTMKPGPQQDTHVPLPPGWKG